MKIQKVKKSVLFISCSLIIKLTSCTKTVENIDDSEQQKQDTITIARMRELNNFLVDSEKYDFLLDCEDEMLQ